MKRIALALAFAAACAAPSPRYHFVMPVASTAPPPAPGEPRVGVLGQIAHPGWVRFRPGLTVIGAIVDAGGFTALAQTRRVQIERGTTRIAVSTQAILDGRAPDLVLAPGDLVFVPESDI
jgi:protein involved in polysaccharide export with SLBB domain